MRVRVSNLPIVVHIEAVVDVDDETRPEDLQGAVTEAIRKPWRAWAASPDLVRQAEAGCLEPLTDVPAGWVWDVIEEERE